MMASKEEKSKTRRKKTRPSKARPSEDLDHFITRFRTFQEFYDHKERLRYDKDKREEYDRATNAIDGINKTLNKNNRAEYNAADTLGKHALRVQHWTNKWQLKYPFSSSSSSSPPAAAPSISSSSSFSPLDDSSSPSPIALQGVLQPNPNFPASSSTSELALECVSCTASLPTASTTATSGTQSQSPITDNPDSQGTQDQDNKREVSGDERDSSSTGNDPSRKRAWSSVLDSGESTSSPARSVKARTEEAIAAIASAINDLFAVDISSAASLSNVQGKRARARAKQVAYHARSRALTGPTRAFLELLRGTDADDAQCLEVFKALNSQGRAHVFKVAVSFRFVSGFIVIH